MDVNPVSKALLNKWCTDKRSIVFSLHANEASVIVFVWCFRRRTYTCCSVCTLDTSNEVIVFNSLSTFSPVLWDRQMFKFSMIQFNEIVFLTTIEMNEFEYKNYTLSTLIWFQAEWFQNRRFQCKHLNDLLEKQICCQPYSVLSSRHSSDCVTWKTFLLSWVDKISCFVHSKARGKVQVEVVDSPAKNGKEMMTEKSTLDVDNYMVLHLPFVPLL